MGSSLLCEAWRMAAYDGTLKITEKMVVLFDAMGKDEKWWMGDYSVLVDCMYFALNNGGVVTKDVVVG